MKFFIFMVEPELEYKKARPELKDELNASRNGNLCRRSITTNVFI